MLNDEVRKKNSIIEKKKNQVNQLNLWHGSWN